MRKKAGYSIVEMLVILGVLGVLVVFSLQLGESVITKSRFSGIMNNFLADFSSAKLLASTENRYVAITFSSDGRSYTIQKQSSISDSTIFTHVKTVTPLSDQSFFTSAQVADFAVNSTGEMRLMPIDTSTPPDNVSLVFFIHNTRGSEIAYQRTIQIFPYGGLKVEKY